MCDIKAKQRKQIILLNIITFMEDCFSGLKDQTDLECVSTEKFLVLFFSRHWSLPWGL